MHPSWPATQGHRTGWVLDAWAKFHLDNQDRQIPINQIHLDVVKRTCWPLVGWWATQKIFGHLNEDVRIHAEALCTYPLWGALNTGGRINTPLRNKGFLTIGDVIDPLGGPLITMRARRAGMQVSENEIQQMYNQIPPSWQEAILKGGFSSVPRVENRTPPSETIQRAKALWGDTRPDIFAAKWGFVWAKADEPLRSGHFLIDLKKSSHSLWWFQHKMGAHAYHLGDRAKYFIKDCTGLCSMCKHKVDYQHLFSWCPGIATFRAQWEREKPLCWSSEPADWLGFPSIRYDTLPQGEKKRVLQWLIQAVEIRRDALFNYMQHVYKGHRRKLEIHHTVRAKLAYRNKPKGRGPEAAHQLPVDTVQVIEPKPQHPPHWVESGGDNTQKNCLNINHMPYTGKWADTGESRNRFVNKWFAAEPMHIPSQDAVFASNSPHRRGLGMNPRPCPPVEDKPEDNTIITIPLVRDSFIESQGMGPPKKMPAEAQGSKHSSPTVWEQNSVLEQSGDPA